VRITEGGARVTAAVAAARAPRRQVTEFIVTSKVGKSDELEAYYIPLMCGTGTCEMGGRQRVAAIPVDPLN
jgi:hypothetical protein